MPQHPAPEPSGTDTDFMQVSWCALDGAEVLAQQAVDAGTGLSSAEVTARRESFGANRLAEPEQRSKLSMFIDQFRSSKVRGIAVDIEAAFELPGIDELERLEFRSELEAVRAALAMMAPELCAVMTAVVLDGQSYREAADLLGIPIGTVMSRLSRARQFVEAHVRRGPERMVAA
jgi:magnesium-transporting ATPase (P-type)